MARTHPRPRRMISSKSIWLLKMLGFRYSSSRDAYVLRMVGNQFGPVYKVRIEPIPEREKELAQ